MKRMIHAATWTAVGLMALCGPAAALGGGEAGELEHARANARAGGPVSERDKELLERWGCLSGTDNAFCKNLSQPRRYRKVQRRNRDRD